MYYKYNHSVLGGTFDHFHKGHENFINAALLESAKLTIGITSDEMLQDKPRQSAIEPYAKREQSIKDFLSQKGYSERTTIFKIDDIYGPSVSDNSLEAIYVISDTYGGAKKVNEKRQSLGLKELEIVDVPTIDINRNKRISSTAIRLGQIDRRGNMYSDFFPKNTSLTLPNSLREQLKEPFGETVKTMDIKNLQNKFTIAVGDIVVSNLLQHDLIPNLSIFDKISNRKKITDSHILTSLPKNSVELENEPGTINCTTALKIENFIQESINTHNKFSLEIHGEEDLLALPAMLFAPLESIVIYGLKNEGAVIVTITESLKEMLITNIITNLRLPSV